MELSLNLERSRQNRVLRICGQPMGVWTPGLTGADGLDVDNVIVKSVTIDSANLKIVCFQSSCPCNQCRPKRREEQVG